MVINPNDCIGKFISFDCDYGALWAHIVDVITINTIAGKKQVLIADRMVSCLNGQVSVHKNGRHAVHLDKMTPRNVIADIRQAAEEDEEMFLKILKMDDRGTTSLELSTRLEDQSLPLEEEPDNIGFAPGMGPRAQSTD
jgi:hypothetical protein